MHRACLCTQTRQRSRQVSARRDEHLKLQLPRAAHAAVMYAIGRVSEDRIPIQ